MLLVCQVVVAVVSFAVVTCILKQKHEVPFQICLMTLHLTEICEVIGPNEICEIIGHLRTQRDV